ncbi:MAG: RNA methyltransferase [Actinomycetota bacterium]|nr:RNA methyltransferase [Actinomycetota bacterium]
MAPELTNPRAERVLAVRALSGRSPSSASTRRRTGTYLVEGPQAVREAVRFAPERVRELYFSESAAARYAEIVLDALERGLHARTTSDEVAKVMSPDAQGVLAVLETVPLRLPDVLASESPRLVAVLSRVRDPGNAGTVIRAADAAGADLVIVTAESVDVHSPKVVRSSAGSLFHVPVVTGVDLSDAAALLHAAGLIVLAADGHAASDLDELADAAGTGADIDLAKPTAWLFGNEAWGLPDADLALADAAVRVPIRGQAESLNLATAAAVCLFASARAQR